MHPNELARYISEDCIRAAYGVEYALSILKPSEVDSHIYWIPAARMVPGDRLTSSAGKWMVFGTWEELDLYWEWIKRETVLGTLGPRSKVSTRRPSNLRREEGKGVICVYTYSSTDKGDVLRVRQELADMGFTQMMYYKTNEATNKGMYGANAWLYKSTGGDLHLNDEEEVEPVVPA